MILFFDTETNGVPKNYKAPVHDLDNWPRVAQLAWQLYHEDGRLFDQGCRLITPDGWEIPKEEFFIKNGHSTERCREQGIAIDVALNEFFTPFNKCRVIVAHNMGFDHPVLCAEMLRAKMLPTNKPAKFCTMLASVDECRLPAPRGGGFKWPKLEELYRHLFQEDFDGAHDAMADVQACARCYFEMKKRELITV